MINADKIILALDVASEMGVAEGPINGLPCLYTISLARRGEERTRKISRAAEWAIKRINEGPRPFAVYIEDPLVLRMRSAATQRLLTSYADTIAGLFDLKRIPVHFVSVRTVRAAILHNGSMKGNAAKEACMRLARLEGLDPQNDNEGDAWAIWRWATSLYNIPRQKELQLV